MKQEFLDTINSLRNSNYRDINSYKTLSKIYLMLIENQEKDEDIWTVYSQLIKDIIDGDRSGERQERFVRKFNRINQDDIRDVFSEEDRYLCLPLEVQKTISYRVMCPRSEENNFGAFF